MVVVGGLLVATFACVAMVSAVYTPHNPREVKLTAKNRPPGRHDEALYAFGTDVVGRDILSRTMAGARISLRVGLFVVTGAIVVGVAVGVLAGYHGSFVDTVLMRLMDMLLAVPGILLAIVIVTVLGSGLRNAMIAVGIVAIPQYARVMRAEVLRVKAQEYVAAARALGASDWRILRRAVLPNCLAPLLVQATLGMGTAILETAGLSYLGLGDEASVPEWGRMIAEQFGYLRRAWWTVVPPLASISLVVLGFNLLGDGLRDALDPRLRQLPRS
jgi:ABC-type dipeptide/oligopeptide/nickel transport system permease subunit